MPKAQSDDWQSLYDRILVTYPGTRYVPKPTRKGIDDFEKASTLVLPKSYCDFIRVFGPGKIGVRFEIYAPGYSASANHKRDLGNFNKDYQGWNKEIGKGHFKYKDEPLIRRMVVFCMTLEGDIIGWDPQDIRDESIHEYGIYYWPHGYNDVSLIATSFEAFIRDFCLGTGFFRFWKTNDEWDLEDDQQSFCPKEDLARSAKKGIARPRTSTKKHRKGQPKTTKEVSPSVGGARRMFELVDGSSDKFWEIERQGASVTVHFGRRGTNGQSKTKVFASAAAARKHLEKLICEKVEKGYLEVK